LAQTTFYAPSAPAGFNRTETYGYEAERDFLTSASYGDGLPNATQTWTYDASQNRSNAGYAYDALNRMTASPDGWSYAHDAVGNRLNRTKPNGDYVTYEWDALNRMTRYFDQPRTTYTNYEYRQDGLRAHKAQDRPGQATLHESSRYDGTMPFEQARYQEGGSATITRSGLGARGIDVEEAKTGTYNSSTGFTLGNWSTPSYPLYDAHGNRVCALTRSGTNSYATDAPRTYDAWGQIRSGGSQNGSPSRYCANLGHVQDDESGLIYMRARFYEPVHGRFISEDSRLQGINWYQYCGNDPVTNGDKSGEWFYKIDQLLADAMRVLTDCNLSSGVKMARLRALGETMKWIARANGVHATALEIKAEIDEETAGLMGNAAAIQLKIVEIERGASYIHRAEGIVATIAAGVIDIMITMAIDGF
jgi:RHS repeat-associated protein